MERTAKIRGSEKIFQKQSQKLLKFDLKYATFNQHWRKTTKSGCFFMKIKKWIAGLLSAVMLFSLLGNAAFAAGSGAGGYHYDQLNALAKTIYDGIGKLDLKTGTDEYDLAQDLPAIPANTELNKAMNAARYAYYADHPALFYVDFPKLTLRSTQDASGNRHVYIGSGRNASYLLSAFSGEAAVTAAIAAFNARVSEIVAGARAVTVETGESLQAAQVKYVHDEIIHHVSYRMEDTAATGNAALLGTPYGVLVKKQGVCEGYARAFKTVMDELGIHCILVQGVHQYSGEVAVNHMWNYVEITDAATTLSARLGGGKWYAVDATLDDPETPTDVRGISGVEYDRYHHHFDAYGEDGFEQEKYLLVGQLTMNERHFEAEEVSAAGGYRFAYPALEAYDFTVTDVSNDLDGFKVIAKDVFSPTINGMLTEYQFSYLGMTVREAKKKGIYLVWRYYKEENGEIVPIYNQYGSWGYIDPDAYAIKEENGYTTIQEGKMPYVEIAATTVPPEKNPSKPYACLTYQGDDSGLIARTGKIYNKNQRNYTPPPFVRRQTPTQTAIISLSDRFYHVTAEFDDALVLAKGYTANTIRTRIECRDRYGAAVSGAKYSEIKNFKWDGDKTVEFDIKFSLMYADNNVLYSIYLEGLVGQTSGKTPNPITYSTRTKGPCPSVMERDGNWDIFGKPALLESDDLSMKGWETANNEPVSELLKNRLTLITTRTTEAQNKQIAEQVEENVTDNIISSETYNIGLSLCKTMVVKTGDRVKVRVGFPAGYGPDDEGVTFKAYHFKRDTQGNVTGVEEIDCVVTQYGLILSCDAFSPFMIAAVEKDGTGNAARTAVVTASDGGAATGSGLDASGIVKLNAGESQTVTYTANEGYQIESVTVCGKQIGLTGGKSATVTVRYDDIGGNNIVNANFVAVEVVEKEQARDEAPVKPAPEKAEITAMPTSRSFTAGDTLTLAPTVAAAPTDSVQTYQWYKDGTKLEGKVNKTLEIQNLPLAAAGRYTLAVTTTVDTVSVESRSSECAVAVTPRPSIVVPGSGNSAAETVTNPDGSRTTIVTNRATGTVTETTTHTDGSTLVVETEKNGTKTTTSTAGNGVAVKTVDAPKRNVTASVTIPGNVGSATVTIPVAAVPGLVAVDAVTGKPVRLSVPGEAGLRVRLDASTTLILEDRTQSFTDAAGHWAADAIDFAVAHELFTGTSETTFTPNSPMTRAMLMTVLARLDGEDTTGGGIWYEKGIAWAIANGVSDGSAPSAPVTREQLATALWRYAGSPAVSDSLASYSDADSVSAYARDAMRWAVSTGVISGMGDGVLAPRNSATRAQVAAILMRYVEAQTR